MKTGVLFNRYSNNWQVLILNKNLIEHHGFFDSETKANNYYYSLL